MMPVISIGTWTEGTPANATLIVTNWLQLGFRGVDTAYVYFDQKEVAAAIASAGVKRSDVFITTKIPGCFDAAQFVESDLKQLNTDYLDLVLIHGPIGFCSGTWKVLEDYYAKGVIKAIGVSNFNVKQLTSLMQGATVAPAVNQIAYSVFEHDDATVDYCVGHNITVEAYSPLGSPGRAKNGTRSVFTDPTVTQIAQAHNVSQAQVALRWIAQGGHVLTVLSESAAHQANDADIFRFSLTPAEMDTLSGIQ